MSEPRRTRRTFALGFMVFAAGMGGALYLATRDGGSDSGAGSTVDVLFASRPVPAGTAGSSAVAQGLVSARKMPASARPANALTEVAQLSGRVSVAPIAQGQVVTSDAFPAAQTRIGTVRIPQGKRALALQLEHVRGVAGFAGAGDRIDVYGVATGQAGTPAGVRLVLQNVEVLNVNGSGLAQAQGQPGGPGLVFLLAVTPSEAERLIYLTEFERLYFDLAVQDEPAVNTPGSGPGDALRVA